MPDFRYHHNIEVRFSDLDALGHVNNACFLTYMEQARISYFKDLGLWTGDSLYDIGFILADAHINFRSPVLFGQLICVQVRISRLGNKSMTMQYLLVDDATRQVMADGSTVLVTYNYRSSSTISIPPEWKATICQFEGLGDEST